MQLQDIYHSFFIALQHDLVFNLQLPVHFKYNSGQTWNECISTMPSATRLKHFPVDMVKLIPAHILQ